MSEPLPPDVSAPPENLPAPAAAVTPPPKPKPAAAAPPKRSHHKKPATPPAKPAVVAGPKPGSAQSADGATAAIEQLQSLLTRLTPAERERLAAAGVTVPAGDVGAIIEGRYTWGLRCTHCGKLALHFVGDQFEMHGEMHDAPVSVPHNKIAWTQELPAHEIDRHDPRCQSCGDMIPVNTDGSFVYVRGNPESDRRVRVAEWDRSRAVRYDTKKARDTVREAQRATASLQAGDSHSFNLPDRPTSSMIDDAHGAGTSQRLDAAAEATGLADAVRRGDPAAVGL